jgi:hypothetical protein
MITNNSTHEKGEKHNILVGIPEGRKPYVGLDVDGSSSGKNESPTFL